MSDSISPNMLAMPSPATIQVLPAHQQVILAVMRSAYVSTAASAVFRGT